ncbi:MAG: hypothetical protein AAFR84_17420 [Pseudomonadota bacterium]
MSVALAIALTMSAGPVAAFQEPAWGTPLRRALMDAVRPIIERDLGAPVRFVVRELRVEGDRGFGWLEPQRPGGRPILFEDTPLAGLIQNSDTIDGTTVHAFYRRENGAWVVYEWSIGATDVWWSSADTCAEFAAVIPEYCS